MKRILFLFTLVLLLSGFIGCSNAYKITADIKTVSYVIRNIPHTFWTSWDDASIYLDTTISYEGNISSVDEIKKLSIMASNDTQWDLTTKKLTLNTEKNLIEYNSLISSRFGSDCSTIPIGDYIFTLTLMNGYKSTFTLFIPAPGSSSTNGANFVFTEHDYATKTSAGIPVGIPALRRATVTRRNKINSDETISITFSCDSITSNGWLWFYNASDDYIGCSYTFRHSRTGNISSCLNEGSDFKTTGNVINLDIDDIVFRDSYNFNSIAKFSLVLTDGRQFLPEVNYNYESWTIKKTL